MAQVNLQDVVDYKTFRTNPGPQLEQALHGHPVLVVKGHQRFVVLDAAEYNSLVDRLEQLEQSAEGRQRTGTNG